ncbi:hypothetical protein PAXRUDRAFT_770151, partial [Paxillus rubicundulus Ve08.2h10]
MLKKLAAFWKGMLYFIIDESLMVSQLFFAKLLAFIAKGKLLAGEGHDNDKVFGGKIYEQFTVIVQLKEQVRVTDPKWMDLLQHVHHG